MIPESADVDDNTQNHVTYFPLVSDTFKSDTKTKRKNPKVYIQMYEIYNEMVKKLLEVPQGQSVFSNITESADKGIHVRVSDS